MTQMDKGRDMKKYLKGSNFDFGSKNKVAATRNYSAVRTTVDQAKQIYAPEFNQQSFVKDQRASHFRMGYDDRKMSTAIRPSNSTSGPTAQSRTLENGQISASFDRKWGTRG